MHKSDLKLRRDYFARTISKARSIPVELDENSLLYNTYQVNAEEGSEKKVLMQLPLQIKDSLIRSSNSKNGESIKIKSEIAEINEPTKLEQQKAGQLRFPTMEEKAFYGLAGDLVRLIEPHSEADPVALLAQILVAFGSIIGRNAHTVAEADLHYTNLNIVLVGESSKARKGTSWGQVRTRIETIEPTWKERIMSGLSSGEGMIWQVRDPITKREKKVDKKTGEITYEEILADPGIDDKRLLIFEGEFASVLNMLQRELTFSIQ